MDSHYLYGAISIALQIGGLVPYLSGIFRGRVKPHLFTWLIWGLIAVIAFAAQWQEGAGPGMWITGMGMLGCLCIMLCAFRYGTRRIMRSDWIALVICLSTIPLWLLTHNRLLSVIIVCCINLVAFWPTIRKSWNRPEGEMLLIFVLNTVAYFFSMLALVKVNLTTILYPLCLMVLNMGFIAMVFLRRKAVNQ